ncbi:DUF3486 family protein [candidate division KSB1 bacterium]|nr:DUF3486 family protein [candidate division KSB1 bacterium]
MPPRSKIGSIPDNLRVELDRRLMAGGFSGYEGLAGWLTEKGFAISKSALHRYGEKFEERLGALKLATDQARVIVESLGDDEGATNEALIRLTQEKMFTLLMELNAAGDEDAARLALPKISRVVSDLARASVSQNKHRQAVREKAQAAAEEAVTVAKKGGLSDEAAEQIRKSILGVAA